MSNLSDMRKKIDAMRVDREAWADRMRQIDADREAKKLKLESSVFNRIRFWFSNLIEVMKAKITY